MKVKDRYLVPLASGYKDILMNFSHATVNEDGKAKHVIVELQLLTATMNQMKNAGPGHAAYEATRTREPLIENKKAKFGRGERYAARRIALLLSKISEKCYAAADQETSDNAFSKEIGELSKRIEAAIVPLTSTNSTALMLGVAEKTRDVLASIRKMYPESATKCGTSLNSQKSSTTNEDGLSSSGNKNLTGNETVEPSGSVSGTNIGTSPSNDSSPTLNNVSGNGTEGK
ncbi:MAG: hypothetical protein IJU76_06835 [Desulfovibrionaceae bacterium]|nr:hypothetical protein [Desulfovibrionaceae bacterium]